MFTFLKQLFPNSQKTPTAQTKKKKAEEEKDLFWQKVYSAREVFYQEKFGDFPSDILKISTLFGVWPGGGLYAIPATKLGSDTWVYTSFGFTNSDMPTTVSVSEVTSETSDGRLTSTSGTLQKKASAEVAAGLAGYGYEMLVITKENSEWPLGFLQWAVNAEILNDAGLLKRVEKYNGLTVEDIDVGENQSVNVLIAKAQSPLPDGTTLPNGAMSLLIATVITEEEMQWSIEHGRDQLLAKLMASGQGQYSALRRASIPLTI